MFKNKFGEPGNLADHARLLRSNSPEALEELSGILRNWMRQKGYIGGQKRGPVISDEELSGSVICISRGVYDHYGIYVNDSSVIHYSSAGSDISFDNTIIETDLATFKRGCSGVYKLDFPSKEKLRRQFENGILEKEDFEPRHVLVNKLVAAPGAFSLPDLGDLLGWSKKKQLQSMLETYRVYGPQETIHRARSRLRENNYSLPSNNCEHFAIWCKTGLSISWQVEFFLKILKKITGFPFGA